MSEGRENNCDCPVCTLRRAGYIKEEGKGWNFQKVYEHLEISAQILYLFAHTELQNTLTIGNLHLIQSLFGGEIEGPGEELVYGHMKRNLDLMEAMRTIHRLQDRLEMADKIRSGENGEETLSNEEKASLMALLKDVDIH